VLLSDELFFSKFGILGVKLVPGCVIQDIRYEARVINFVANDNSSVPSVVCNIPLPACAAEFAAFIASAPGVYYSSYAAMVAADPSSALPGNSASATWTSAIDPVGCSANYWYIIMV
jgi:hypothetical protein